jgi:hypothetical protein
MTLRALLGLCAVPWVVACFDSDETFKAAGTTTTGEPDPTTTAETTTTTAGSSTTEDPINTCRDAVDCVIQCAFDIAIEMPEEPDLSCLVDCIEETLTVLETVKLLELVNCTSQLCRDEGICVTPDETTGGSSDSGTDSSGSSSSSGSSTTTEAPGETGDPPLISPCIQCVFDKINMPAEDLGVCEELALECV